MRYILLYFKSIGLIFNYILLKKGVFLKKNKLHFYI